MPSRPPPLTASASRRGARAQSSRPPWCTRGASAGSWRGRPWSRGPGYGGGRRGGCGAVGGGEREEGDGGGGGGGEEGDAVRWQAQRPSKACAASAGTHLAARGRRADVDHEDLVPRELGHLQKRGGTPGHATSSRQAGRGEVRGSHSTQGSRGSAVDLSSPPIALGELGLIDC